MSADFNVKGIDYFILGTARDAETFSVDMMIFTDSLDIGSNIIKNGIIGCDHILISPKDIFNNQILNGLIDIPQSRPVKGIDLGLYEHFKLKLYDVIGAGLNIISLNEIVLYQQRSFDLPVCSNGLYARNKKEFFENVTNAELNYNGPRFKRII